MSTPEKRSGQRSSTAGSPLDALVREAKHDLEPRVSEETWSALEDRIVARMAEERSPLIDDVRAPSSRTRVLRIGAAVLAAAAAVALVVKKDPSSALLGAAPSHVELTASSLRSTEGVGEIRVGGQPASIGHELRAGDLVEAEGARALLERPRKVTWLLEHGSTEGNAAGRHVGRARVKSAGESLVLGLEDGAIEAQVTPVPNGEAFAVDIAAGTNLVRVAVHGTHLRVSRVGSRVVVDLSEGVVSIGAPPRNGSTYGTLVTAPSHVEFDAADVDHTLRIDHAPAAVRAPVALVFHDGVAGGVAARTDNAAPAPEKGATPSEPSTAPLATVPRPASGAARPAADPSHLGAAAKVDPSKPVLAPREAIAAAVRGCAAARSRPENVRVSVSSSLRLKIAAGGDVETAQFDPPLLPEIQTCAAAEIYKAKIEESAGRTVTIPIAFSY
jgi:hypothetical protein